ncbi:PQ loop repeat-domain-containing protein [Filobasidium floriforme]|uniref:PQ loop repeat-domain-containing protein n=1 Tax=Filobasidium floriforme TaxID=5210 RepID=UPI001E8D2BB5|nr:PQ loop repeat-domain-containing protein [Filobasidium floriforme]KAH8082272.1 PQ loop repeat-domain-containing protein [Filobasidium floriforme]
MARLLPTMIILAVYYSVCDIVLLVQLYYYRATQQRDVVASESQPLLSPDADVDRETSKAKVSPYITYPLLTIGIAVVGIASWYIQRSLGQGGQRDGGLPKLEWKSQVLGYISAALYLGSRIPQIAHNYHTRCEGLSLAMFFFSISGNLTYVASILCKSLDREYVLANTSWLIGSGGTVLLDCIVLAQFVYFARGRPVDPFEG